MTTEKACLDMEKIKNLSLEEKIARVHSEIELITQQEKELFFIKEALKALYKALPYLKVANE